MTSRRRTSDASLGVTVLALDTLTRDQSLALLHKFPAAQNMPPFTPAEAAVLEAIAAELGDLPLALHLAGSYLARYRRDVTPEHYLAQLRQPDLLAHRSLIVSDLTPQADALSPTQHLQHVAHTFALSYARLDPANPVDALAQRLLAQAAWFAPGQPIPRALLLASSEPTASEEDRLQATDALAHLVDLGLLATPATGDLLMHRLLAHFGQRVNAPLSQPAQQAVAATLLDEANRINNAGLPGPLLAWQAHLRHITDLVQGAATAQAASLCNTLGFHLHMIGDYAAARPYLERALTIHEAVLGAKHPATARSLNNLGMLLKEMGDYAAARPYLERALAINEEVLGVNHPHTQIVRGNLAALPAAQPSEASS